MKKLIFIFLVSLLASCSGVNVSVEPGPLVTPKDNNSFVENPVEIKIDEDDSQGVVTIETDNSPIRDLGPYENPFLIYGTDFGNYFQTMYNHGKYEQMLAFTSKQSIDKFGEQGVLDFYKNELDFGYDIGDSPLSSGSDGDMIVINYKADIMATKTIIRVNVVIENDSCKIVLPNDLKNFPS